MLKNLIVRIRNKLELYEKLKTGLEKKLIDGDLQEKYMKKVYPSELKKPKKYIPLFKMIPTLFEV